MFLDKKDFIENNFCKIERSRKKFHQIVLKFQKLSEYVWSEFVVQFFLNVEEL